MAVENVTRALASGQMSDVERSLGPRDIVLRAYVYLCRGRPADAKAAMSAASGKGGPPGLAIFRAIRAFEGSNAIRELPEPRPGRPQSPEREDEVYDELRGLPEDPLLSDIRAMEQIARDRPEDAVLQFQLGEIYGFRKNDARRGRLHFEAAIRADPSRGLFWGYTAELVFKRFDTFEALEYYNRAVLVDPENPRWHLYRAQVLMLVFGQSLNEEFVIDTREEALCEGRTAFRKAENLGQRYRIFTACRSHLERVEDYLKPTPIPSIVEQFGLQVR